MRKKKRVAPEDALTAQLDDAVSQATDLLETLQTMLEDHRDDERR